MEERNEASSFYDKVGQLAKAHGATINVISIRGDDCSMENLGT